MGNAQISIYCMTFNHALYIRDTIEGFLMQETEYTYHIFIFDDASNDGTSKIIRKYADEYPDKIDIYISEKNTYGTKLRVELLERLRREYLTGKYIALCEGDDCWINPHKLQTQVKFMEMHPECVMTVHAAWLIDYRTGEKRKHSAFNKTGYLSAEDLILRGRGGLPTASFVLNREIYFGRSVLPKCSVGDMAMWLFAITKGKIYYFNKQMSLYRYMHDDSWSVRYTEDMLYAMKHGLDMIDFLKLYDEYTERRFYTFVRTNRSEYFYDNLFENYDSYDKAFYERKCDELSRQTNGKYDKIIERMIKMRRLLRDEFYSDEEIQNYMKKYKYIVVMGMGKYSKIITRYLQNKETMITGYILSDHQDVPEDKKIKIWRIKDYPYPWEETGVIIALHPKWQAEVEIALQKGRIISYYAPFWIEDRHYCRRQ